MGEEIIKHSKSYKSTIIGITIFIVIVVVAYFASKPEPGEVVDTFNGVSVYYNGKINNEFGRNVTEDGYNIGVKYQCVEYVKRYYYEYLGHKMPDSYGHAKDFYNSRLADGEYNAQRGLIQYSNPGSSKPEVNDIIVMKGKYGHVGIVSYVTADAIEIVQQNTQKPRRTMSLLYKEGLWTIDNSRVLGWLRMETYKDGYTQDSDVVLYPSESDVN